MSNPTKRLKVSQLSDEDRTAHKLIIRRALSAFGDCMIVLMQLSESWPEENVMDGDYLNAAFSIVLTYHKGCCQVINGTGTIKDNIAPGKKVTCVAGKELDWKDITPIFGTIFDKYQLAYKKGIDKPWYGVANPVLYSFAAFHHRMKEVHLGTVKYDVGKGTDGTRKTRTIAHYGMRVEHSPLCEGITYPPYMKSPLLSSLGPGTLLAYWLDNASTNDKIYREKIKNALMEAFAQVPLIEDIVETLSKLRLEECKGIVEKLCTFLTLGGYKCKNRATFPPYMILQDSMQRIVIEQNVVRGGATPMNVDEDVPGWKLATVSVFEMKFLDGMDLTGAGMWKTYKAIKPARMRFGKHGGEILTHCILGTHKEDFGILKYATGVEFHTRSELGDAFSARSKLAPTVTSPIPFLRVSKMVTANTAPQLAAKKKQIFSTPVLGGFRAKMFTKEHIDFLNDQVKKEKSGMRTSERNLEIEICDNISDAMRAFEIDGKVGTVSWYTANAEGTYDPKKPEEGKLEGAIANEIGLFFR